MVEDKLMPFARLFRIHEQPEMGMWLLYITIVILSYIVYKLGFSVKLPMRLSIVIFIFLLAGSTLLTFFAAFLPIVEGLLAAVAILVLYKIRLRKEKAEGKFDNLA